jgi:hypothetical protein
MAGLAILKHTFDLSDEVVCARWVENPYYRVIVFFRHINRNESTYSHPSRHRRCLVSTTDDFPNRPVDLTRIYVSPQGKNRGFPTPVGKVGLTQLRLLRIWIGRDLCNELVEDRLPERVEVLGDHDEGPRAANHVVSVVIIEASRRIGVVGAEIRRILGQNDEAIDGHAFGKSFVTRNSDVAAGIIVSIPRNVDGAACGVVWRAGELRYGEIDAATNRQALA